MESRNMWKRRQEEQRDVNGMKDGQGGAKRGGTAWHKTKGSSLTSTEHPRSRRLDAASRCTAPLPPACAPRCQYARSAGTAQLYLFVVHSAAAR